MTSAKEIVSLTPKLIKIPSACNTHFDLAAYLCESYAGEIHVSLGMTTAEEIDRIVAFYQERDRLKDVVLYHCTSGYPIAFDEANLLEITRIKERWGDAVKGIGFSGHHRGIAIDVAAYTLGATYIERHFTLDRTQKGTDHAASLEPDGLRRIGRDLAATHAALRYKDADILEVEVAQRKKLKWDRNA
jgi:N-acetylneuraminate synthase